MGDRAWHLVSYVDVAPYLHPNGRRQDNIGSLKELMLSPISVSCRYGPGWFAKQGIFSRLYSYRIAFKVTPFTYDISDCTETKPR